MSASKEAHMGHLAAKDWEERVTKEDPRASIGWQSFGNDHVAQNACQETHHTDCQHGNPWLSSY